MKIQRILLMSTVVGAACRMIAAEPHPSLNSHLEFLGPLLGKTWRGVFNGSKPDKPTIDVARWERALNGQAVRMVHSINQGVYGVETIVMWNEKSKAVEYYYFTTAGFMTTGTMTFTNGKIETHEEVKGDAGGVTEVRATSEILPEGTFHVKAQYRKGGEWALGHEVTYKQDPGAEVIFK
jgi:hypothetical protein